MLWDGELGGAEVMCAGLATAMRKLGVQAELVFVNYAGPLAERLAVADVPFHVWGCQRGRDVLRHPRRYAAVVEAVGPDGVLVTERGFLGAVLRLGGYRGRIVSIEQGSLLLKEPSKLRELVKWMNIAAAAWADDVQVGVSEFMMERMCRGMHTAHLCRIYNGIDCSVLALPEAPRRDSDGCEIVVGFAGRLIPGKGADDGIAAIARGCKEASLRLLIAGKGPELPRLSSLAQELGVRDRIEFLGLVEDIEAFWHRCDVGIFPSHQFIESFGMAALEAMACGKPVIATRNGGAPEIVVDGVTGTIVEPGDVAALAQALVTYAGHPELRRARGAAGRARAVEKFDICESARAYLRCFGDMVEP